MNKKHYFVLNPILSSAFLLGFDTIFYDDTFLMDDLLTPFSYAQVQKDKSVEDFYHEKEKTLSSFSDKIFGWKFLRINISWIVVN